MLPNRHERVGGLRVCPGVRSGRIVWLVSAPLVDGLRTQNRLPVHIELECPGRRNANTVRCYIGCDLFRGSILDLELAVSGSYGGGRLRDCEAHVCGGW